VPPLRMAFTAGILWFNSQMEVHEARQSSDEILLPFLQASDEPSSEFQLAALISDHAKPIASSVIRYRLRVFCGTGSRPSQDTEDVYGDFLIKLIARLRNCKTNQDAGINNFHAYVRAIASNSCSAYLRQKSPQRSSLDDKLRYFLTHRTGFALWKSDADNWFCGRQSWQAQPQTAGPSVRVRQLCENPREVAPLALSGRDAQRLNLPDLLTALFDWIDGPIELDDLIFVVAELLGLKDQLDRPTTLQSQVSPATAAREIKDPSLALDVELDQRYRLRQLWAEICALPARQRFALLMNLRDAQGRELTGLLPLTGVCTFRQIAAALELSAEALALLCKDLPMDDATIAERLGGTRQQVINLRKSARERLARRMNQLV
jgi:DNA-directed RNA polymerase specialized sigma24 family protein